MKFNNSKYKVLYVVQENPGQEDRLGEEYIENNPDVMNLGILVDENIDMSRQCTPAAQKANCILDCKKTASWTAV